MLRLVTGRATLAAALMASGLLPPPAGAGDPIGHHPSPPIAPTAAVAAPIPTVARSPYLGTFRPDPVVVVRSGNGTGGSYVPAGQFPRSDYLSVYGPVSRLRSIPTEVVEYARGFDGAAYPVSSGIVYTYTDLRQYPDSTLVPTGFRYRPGRGLSPRSVMAPYLVGQY